MSGERDPLHEYVRRYTVRIDREPVSFRLPDVFQMAFCVGCGLTLGAMVTIGAVAFFHRVMTWLA